MKMTLWGRAARTETSRWERSHRRASEDSRVAECVVGGEIQGGGGPAQGGPIGHWEELAFYSL